MNPASRSRHHALLACAALALALLASAACSRRAGGPPADSRTSGEAVAGRVPAGGDTITTATRAGNDLAVIPIGALAIRDRVRQHRGVTLVNVWATWCAPCRAEMPALLRVARAHRDDGMRLMLVSADFDDQLPAVRRFLATQSVTDTTFLKQGADMSFINTLHPDWSGALPATLVYDANGRLTNFWEGAADEDRFEHAVIAALAATPRLETRP